MWPKHLTSKAVWFFVVAAIALPAAAQGVADPVLDSLHQRVSRFLEQVSSGTAVSTAYQAYQDLLTGGPLSTRKSELDELIKNTDKIRELYGEYKAFEQVYTRRVGADLVFMKYLYKCERFPVLWHITFYRPPEQLDLSSESGATWQVISIRFDTNLEVLTLLKN